VFRRTSAEIPTSLKPTLASPRHEHVPARSRTAQHRCRLRQGPGRCTAISLCVLPGEVIALIGANGAGKSTTLRAISGLIKPTAGDILLDGMSITGQRPDQIVRGGIAHCPEERRVWPELSVQENLSLGAYICKDSRGGETADRVGPRAFPTAARARHAVGRNAVGRRAANAGDRPRLDVGARGCCCLTSRGLGLSPMIMQEVLSVIRLLRDQGITIVLVEQNVHNALSVADRAYVFETGMGRSRGQRERLAAESRPAARLSRWLVRRERVIAWSTSPHGRTRGGLSLRRALRVDIQRVDRLARGHEQAVALQTRRSTNWRSVRAARCGRSGRRQAHRRQRRRAPDRPCPSRTTDCRQCRSACRRACRGPASMKMRLLVILSPLAATS